MELKALNVCFNSIGNIFVIGIEFNFSVNHQCSCPNGHTSPKVVTLVSTIVLDSNLMISKFNAFAVSNGPIKSLTTLKCLYSEHKTST
jgi:hypothetical protein